VTAVRMRDRAGRSIRDATAIGRRRRRPRQAAPLIGGRAARTAGGRARHRRLRHGRRRPLGIRSLQRAHANRSAAIERRRRRRTACRNIACPTRARRRGRRRVRSRACNGKRRRAPRRSSRRLSRASASRGRTSIAAAECMAARSARLREPRRRVRRLHRSVTSSPRRHAAAAASVRAPAAANARADRPAILLAAATRAHGDRKGLRPGAWGMDSR
jgi:hypothetical protein